MNVGKIRASILVLALIITPFMPVGNISKSLGFIGILFNVGAVLSNGFRMPVKHRYCENDSTYFRYKRNSEVHLWFFTDRFSLKSKKFLVVFSLGDIFIYAGIGLLFFG